MAYGMNGSAGAQTSRRPVKRGKCENRIEILQTQWQSADYGIRTGQRKATPNRSWVGSSRRSHAILGCGPDSGFRPGEEAIVDWTGSPRKPAVGYPWRQGGLGGQSDAAPRSVRKTPAREWISKRSARILWLLPPSNVSCRSSAKPLFGSGTKRSGAVPNSRGGIFGASETSFGMLTSGLI
jgi:hypothetical protein